MDSTGNIYVADWFNNTIRKGIPTASLSPVVLRSPNFVPGQFSFGITGPSGLRADIQTATSLSNWQTIASYVLENGTNYFLTPAQPQSNQFYRTHVP